MGAWLGKEETPALAASEVTKASRQGSTGAALVAQETHVQIEQKDTPPPHRFQLESVDYATIHNATKRPLTYWNETGEFVLAPGATAESERLPLSIFPGRVDWKPDTAPLFSLLTSDRYGEQVHYNGTYERGGRYHFRATATSVTFDVKSHGLGHIINVMPRYE